MDSLISFIAQIFGKNDKGQDVLEKELIQFNVCMRCRHYRPQKGMSICHSCARNLHIKPVVPPSGPRAN